MKRFWPLLDRLLERLLRRLTQGVDARQHLAWRIQRTSFALAILLAAGLGATGFTLHVLNLRANIHDAQATSLRLLAGGMREELDDIADQLRFLSQSPLIWTAISDSAGRDAYLGPYLRGQNLLKRKTHLTLLDYRGRRIAGGIEPLAAEIDTALRAPLRESLLKARPVGHLLADERLVLAFPVFSPYTEDVIGVLLAEIRLGDLLRRRADRLPSDVGLTLSSGGKMFLSVPEWVETRHVSRRATLVSREVEGLFNLELEMFALKSPWLAPLAVLLASYLAVAVLLIGFTWVMSLRLALSLTRRLERLTESIRRGDSPQTLSLHWISQRDDDEISLLGRALQDSLLARQALTDNLEAQVAERTRQLAESEAHYRLLAENMHDVVWVLDLDRLRYLYLSPSIARLRGYSADEVRAQAISTGLHPRDYQALLKRLTARAVAIRAGMLPADAFDTLQVEQLHQTGQRFWTEVIMRYQLDTNTGHVCIYGVTRDISARRHAEHLEHFAAFQAGLAEMSAAVLHHIGNAITAARNDAEALARNARELGKVAALLAANSAPDHARQADPEAASRDALAHQLSIQRETAQTLARLRESGLDAPIERIGAHLRRIADLLDTSRNTQLPGDAAREFDLRQLLDDALAMLASTTAHEPIDAHESIEISVEVEPGVSTPRLPRNRLLQLVLSVLRNAREAIATRAAESTPPSGGRGRIRVQAEQASGERLRLMIEDNGIGIDTSQREHLFRAGYSTKPFGAGFGLHAAALFARELGGEIALESTGRDQGARLVLELSYRVADAEHETP